MYVMDLAAKIDQCAEYLCKAKWGDIDFPPPFGREAYPEVCIKTACMIFYRQQTNTGYYLLIAFMYVGSLYR